MKKLIFLMALIITMPLIAQEQRNTITVVGETQAAVEDNSYTILISLQPIYVYEGQGRSRSCFFGRSQSKITLIN